MFQDGSFKTTSVSHIKHLPQSIQSPPVLAITLSQGELPSNTFIPLHQTDTAQTAQHVPTITHKLRCTVIDWFQTFPFQQFHVLFDSLFKVLFIFPSQYLFAIGLLPLFSLRWSIPPTLGCNPKQPDSMSWPILSIAITAMHGTFTLHSALFQRTHAARNTQSSLFNLQFPKRI